MCRALLLVILLGFQEAAVASSHTSYQYEQPAQLAHQQAQYTLQAREREIKMLTQQAQTAAALARERQQKRSLMGVSCLLALGWVAGSLFYWNLRRNRALLAKANDEIRASMAEKEVLVQEIHHRVKNNLQLVSSLLGWQSSILPDPTLVEVLAASQARIQSMAMVHEFLYRADNLAQVRLDAYLAELLNSLHESFTTPQNPIKFTAELDAVVMEAKDATAFGLLLNELVTNAYKHAFNQQVGGELHISLTKVRCPYEFTLRVTDNGVGLSTDGIEARPNSLGMHLIKTLAKQLKATVTATPNQPTGTCIEVIRH